MEHDGLILDNFSLFFKSFFNLTSNLSLIFMRNRKKTLGVELYHFSYWGKKEFGDSFFLSMESLINLLEDHELLLASFEFNNPIHVLFDFLPIDFMLNTLYLRTHYDDYHTIPVCTAHLALPWNFMSFHFCSHRLAHLFVSLIFLIFLCN